MAIDTIQIPVVATPADGSAKYNPKEISYSYSRLAQYEKCGWAYKLKYIDKHFIDTSSLANELGTLVHKIEEEITTALIKGEKPNYEELIHQFRTVNQPKEMYDSTKKDPNKKKSAKSEEALFGTEILAKKYGTQFYDHKEQNGVIMPSYSEKCDEYVKTGIYRQEKFYETYPDIEPVAAELEFNVRIQGILFHGFIDRVMRYKGTDRYIIVDIKSKDKMFKSADLTTPLQMVIYGIALKDMYNLQDYPEFYIYDLPFLDVQQSAGTKNFINRGFTKISKLLDGIAHKEFKAKPTPLCHWCEFCGTNPNQKPEAIGYCPFQSMWASEEPSFAVLNPWSDDPEQRKQIMEDYRKFQVHIPEEYQDLDVEKILGFGDEDEGQPSVQENNEAPKKGQPPVQKSWGFKF